jgi:type I site-specific restriction endonuclease
MLHEEEETQHTTSGEHVYQPEDLCDKEIRDSSTIGRDSAPFEDEVMHLMLRLKALEANRDLMKQTIESLRRENGEMKLLQEIAQQLRELRGMEQTDLQQQLNLLPFASSCQVSPDSL